jgi:phosphodiesterase/alkaline phosphatase D-like protein
VGDTTFGAPLDRDRLEGLAATRRRFLTWTGAAAAVAFTPKLLGLAAGTASASPHSATAPAWLRDHPFRLGVASGDPAPDSVVLWTRLATDALAPFGGMEYESVPVRWQVAEDDRFRRVVRQGTVHAAPDWGHSVHVEVDRLRPWREYFYRFRVDGPGGSRHDSPVGRTKTAPTAGARLRSMSLAFASCQAWYEGFYTAYADMAQRHHDLVFHAGDYIYEYSVGLDGGVRQVDLPSRFSRETITLDDYRDRHALYRSDPDLQAAHASAPWVVAWDDHELENNWADEISENDEDPATFLVRRANSLRAYYENMPLREPQRPDGIDLQLYRRLTYGNLLQLDVLDTRQYRDDQAAGDGTDPPNPGSLDPARSITGQAQEDWLLDGFASSRARWNVLAHQTAIAQLDTRAGTDVAVPMDTWDGYVGSRNRVLQGAQERGVRNLVSIAGDLHRSVASDLKLDFADPASPTVGSEFVGTSITSGRDGMDIDPSGQTLLDENPHIKYCNFQRGYVSCTITPELWHSDYRVADFVTRPGGTMSTRTNLVVEDGHPGVQQA